MDIELASYRCESVAVSRVGLGAKHCIGEVIPAKVDGIIHVQVHDNPCHWSMRLIQRIELLNGGKQYCFVSVQIPS